MKAETWRILVGDDAHRMDEMVRADPASAYEPGFFQRLTENVGWQLGGGARAAVGSPAPQPAHLGACRDPGRKSLKGRGSSAGKAALTSIPFPYTKNTKEAKSTKALTLDDWLP